MGWRHDAEPEASLDDGRDAMTNPSKQKGTAYESALVTWLREDCYVDAYRRPLTGGADEGDLGVHGVSITIEAKNCKAHAWSEWFDELEVEKLNSGSALGILAVKRRGKNAAGSYFAMSGETLELLLDAWMVRR